MKRMTLKFIPGVLWIAVFLLSSCHPAYKVTKAEGTMVAIDSTWDVNPDSEAMALLAPYKAKVDSIMLRVVGTAEVSMDKGAPESLLSNLVADVLRNAAGQVLGKPADMGLINMGGLRNVLTEGPITCENIYEILPFENSLCVLTMKGVYLKELFNNIAACHGQGVSGMQLLITKDGKLLEGTVAGRPIEDEQLYTIATIDYLADGNDGTPLICGIIILAILIVLYVVGSARKNKTTETKESTITQDEIGQKLSTNDNAVDILVENKNGKFEFEKAKDSWKIKGCKEVTLSNDVVNLIVNGVESLYAIETIEENPQSVEKYGLSKPVATVSAKYENKNQTVLKVGNLSTDKKYYYVQVDNSPSVYMVNANACSLFTGTMNDFVDKNVPKVDTNSIVYMEIDYRDKDDILVEYDKDNSLVKEYADKNGLATLVLKKPVSDIVVYPYSLQATALEDASALNVEKLVDPKPTDLSKYGLDNPEMKIVLKDRNTELTVKVGSKVQDDSDINYRYVQINNRNEVFTMDQRALQSFFDADIVDFVQPFVSLHSRSSVNKIEAENNDKKFNVEFKSEGENTFVKTKEGIEKDNRNAYVSGKLVKRELFTPFYQNIVGLSFDSILKENANVTGTPQAVITYVMKDGSKEKIEFYNYDDSYYVAKKGESSTLVVNKQSVRKLFLDAEKVLKGESVENSDSEKGQSS